MGESLKARLCQAQRAHGNARVSQSLMFLALDREAQTFQILAVPSQLCF